MKHYKIFDEAWQSLLWVFDGSQIGLPVMCTLTFLPVMCTLIFHIFRILDSHTLKRVHTNNIVIRDLLETHRRPSRLTRDPLETSARLIGDLHAPSETYMPQWRPTSFSIGNQHSPSEIGMAVETHWRPTCQWSPIGI